MNGRWLIRGTHREVLVARPADLSPEERAEALPRLSAPAGLRKWLPSGPAENQSIRSALFRIHEDLYGPMAPPGALPTRLIWERLMRAVEAGRLAAIVRPLPMVGGGPPHPDETVQGEPAPVSTTWIEIVLVDDADKPVPGEPYELTLPTGTVVRGSLDSRGTARVDGIPAGTCQVTFPRLDRKAWNQA